MMAQRVEARPGRAAAWGRLGGRGGGWGWAAVMLAIAGLLSLPVLVVVGNVFLPADEIWRQLAATVLPRYVLNSLWLMAGVGLGVLVIGTGTAWLVTMCRFPGSGVATLALL